MGIFHLDLMQLAATLGYLGLFCVVFAESGLFFGFFLPGDSLLFSAGLLSAQGIFNPLFLIVLLAFAAIFGDTVGFWFGAKVGSAIFKREDSLFFHKKHIERTKKFYEKYGPRTIILARFVPIVRTFGPILAGVGSMNYKKFLSYNVLGGIGWTFLVTGAGYFLGTRVPGIEHYITYIVMTIIIVSFIPVLWEFRKPKSEI